MAAALQARLAECERERDKYRDERYTLCAQLAETQKLLEVQLAVGDKLEAEVKRLTEDLSRARGTRICAGPSRNLPQD
jgi:chromosome segregation ATPase